MIALETNKCSRKKNKKTSSSSGLHNDHKPTHSHHSVGEIESNYLKYQPTENERIL